MLDSIFMSVITISVTTGILIIAMTLSSSRLNRRFVAKWKYWVWLLLAVRLLIPFNITFPSAPVQISVPDTPVAAAPSVQQAPLLPEPALAPVAVNVNRPAAPPSTLTAIELSAIIWLTGAALYLAWQISAYLRFKRQALRWGHAAERRGMTVMLEQLCAEMDIRQNVTLLISQKVSSPMMIGFFKSYLLLPGEDYADNELVYILRHELVHLGRRDIWYKLLLLFANAIHWFNPAAHLLFHEAGKDLEFACDDEVIRGLSFDARKEYSDTIFRAIHRQHFKNTALSTYFYGGTKTMKERFANILSLKKKRAGKLAAAAVLICVAVIGGIAVVNTVSAIDPAEYDALYDKYIASPSIGMITSANWDDANEVDPDHYINYYADTFLRGGGSFEVAEDYGMYIPAEEMETFVQNHFDVTVEHLRTAKYYIPERNAYEFGGLGSAVEWVITGAERKGKLLTIEYDVRGWYTYAKCTTVIEVNGGNYKYVSNRKEATAQFILDFPSSSFVSDENGVFTIESGGLSSISSDGVNWTSYDGKTLSSIIGFYCMQALPELGAVEETSESLQDGWRWTGTYRDGKPLVVDVQRRFGGEDYIITILYEENASVAGRAIVDTIRLDRLDTLYADYVALPFSAGLLDSYWEVPFNIQDKGALVRLYALMENKKDGLRFPTSDMDVFLQQYFQENDLDMIRYSIWYDEAGNTYFSDRGFEEESGPWCRVTKGERDGNNLILYYEVHAPENEAAVLWEGELTVVLSESGYKYASNYRRYPLYPITQDAAYLNEVTQKYIWWLAPYSGILRYSWPTPQDIKADNLIDICSANNLLNLLRENGEYVEHHGPAALVEAAIQQYFDVSAEYLRTSSRYHEDYTDEYNGERYINEYMIGDGGGWSGAVALHAQQNGDLLRITVGIYGPDDEPDRPVITGLLTIRLNGDSFMYLSYELE